MRVITARLLGCDRELLNQSEALMHILVDAAECAGLTVLHRFAHAFQPQGATAFVALAESHMAVHSWPERGELFVDLATCGPSERATRAFEAICTRIPHAQVVEVPGGLPASARRSA